MTTSKECPFCKQFYEGNVCMCGAYNVMPGYENKKLKEQPYYGKTK